MDPSAERRDVDYPSRREVDRTEAIVLREVSRMERDLMLAINGMRERHHEAVNNMVGQQANLSVQQGKVQGQLEDVRQDIAEIRGELRNHEHPGLLAEIQRMGTSMDSTLKTIKFIAKAAAGIVAACAAIVGTVALARGGP